MNKDRMERLANFVETVPHCMDQSEHEHSAKKIGGTSFVFNMSDVFESLSGWSNSPNCGTRGCLLGSALCLKDMDEHGEIRLPNDDFEIDVFEEGEEWLDISKEESEVLFDPEPHSLRQRDISENYNYNKITPQQAAEAVRKAINHGPGFDNRVWDHLPEPEYDD